MKREFVYSVAMICTQDQFDCDLKLGLNGLADDILNPLTDAEPILSRVSSGMLLPVKFKNTLPPDSIPVIGYNPALFIALSSMSKGSYHYPGEWVKYGNSSHLYQIVRKTDSGDYQVKDGDTNFIAQPTQLTKATKDEIIAWFTKDEVLKSKSEPSGFNPDAGNPCSENERLRSDGKTVLLQAKPPLGIIPRKLHEETRIRDLMAAIDRHLTEGMNIPEKWQDELNDLLYSRVDREVEA